MAQGLTQAELARRLNVSQQTVSFALRGVPQVSEKMRQRVLKAAAKYGYRPNAAARAMRSRKYRQIGVLIRNTPGARFTHPMAYETILGINEGLQPEGYVVTLVRIDDVAQDLAESSRVFEEHLLDGMVVLDAMPESIQQGVENLVPHCIWADSNVWRETRCIQRDERRVGQIVVEQAAALGYREIVALAFDPSKGTPPEHYSHEARLRGLADTAREKGLAYRQVNFLGDDEVVHETFRHAARQRDAVVVAETAYIAKSVQSLATRLRLMPGWDFGLICCDDGYSIHRHWPDLSRCSYDRFGLGTQAAQMLLSLTNGVEPESVRLPTEWIAGATARGPGLGADDRTDASHTSS